MKITRALITKVCLCFVPVAAVADNPPDVPLPRFDSVDDQLETAMDVYQTGGYVNGPKEEEAVNLFEPLAEAGCAQAQYIMGRMTERSSQQQSLEWTRRAAEQGHAAAQYTMGMEYKGSSEEAENAASAEEQATEWFRRAADQGHFRAMAELVNRYRTGTGVDGRDLVQAYKWNALIIPRLPAETEQWRTPFYQRSFVRSYFDDIASDMTPAEVERAKRLAAEWEEEHNNIHHYPEDAERPHFLWFHQVEGGCDR